MHSGAQQRGIFIIFVTFQTLQMRLLATSCTA